MVPNCCALMIAALDWTNLYLDVNSIQEQLDSLRVKFESEVQKYQESEDRVAK